MLPTAIRSLPRTWAGGPLYTCGNPRSGRSRRTPRASASSMPWPNARASSAGTRWRPSTPTWGAAPPSGQGRAGASSGWSPRGGRGEARGGALKRRLPVGYVRDGTGQVVQDPDRRVQEAIELVFRKFRELASGRQTFLWFRGHGVELPVNKSRGGPMRGGWQLPTHSFLQNLLRNPYYAGAYVWGRRETVMAGGNGKLRRRQGSPRRAA